MGMYHVYCVGYLGIFALHTTLNAENGEKIIYKLNFEPELDRFRKN